MLLQWDFPLSSPACTLHLPWFCSKDLWFCSKSSSSFIVSILVHSSPSKHIFVSPFLNILIFPQSSFVWYNTILHVIFTNLCILWTLYPSICFCKFQKSVTSEGWLHFSFCFVSESADLGNSPLSVNWMNFFSVQIPDSHCELPPTDFPNRCPWLCPRNCFLLEASAYLKADYTSLCYHYMSSLPTYTWQPAPNPKTLFYQ